MKKIVIIILAFYLSLASVTVNESKVLSLESAIKMYEGKERIEEIKVLVDEDIDAQNKDGKTALMVASQKGYTEIAQALIASDADVNTKDINSTTALMLASAMGHTEIVKLLEEAGAK